MRTGSCCHFPRNCSEDLTSSFRACALEHLRTSKDILKGHSGGTAGEYRALLWGISLLAFFFFFSLSCSFSRAIKLISQGVIQVPVAVGSFSAICVKTCYESFAYETLIEGIMMPVICFISVQTPKWHNPLAVKDFFRVHWLLNS